MRQSNAEYQKRWRDKQRQVRIDRGDYQPRGWNAAALGRKNRKPWNVKGGRARGLPFVSIDGEGGGVDSNYRQDYLILTMGEKELFTGTRLSTDECLDFICSAPRNAILVGFYFGYDTTQILRDLPPDRLKRLFDPWFEPSGRGARQMVWTYYSGYGIKYLPKQYLSVCRLDRDNKPIKGSTRTVWETGGFFQGSFLKQLKAFKIGTPEEQDFIERMKDARAEFGIVTDEIRRYNQLEVKLHAELMEAFREHCIAADMVPRTWNGAGKLARVLHDKHQTIRKDDYNVFVPERCRTMAHDAYYGGRFEVTRIGRCGDCQEYDICSAYPAAMSHLPCLRHGRWVPFGSEGPKGKNSLYVASVLFSHGKPKNVYGIPIRSERGSICWPNTGAGTYWSVELNSAKALGCKWKFQEGYEYLKLCDCQMFDWVNDLYEYRLSIGKSGPGYPIKLGINSLYGLLAQKVGAGKYSNFLYAGLITAHTRASINRAIAQSPNDILMIATDGVYSKVPLDLPIGDKLGDWEHAELSNLFIVKPGLYWTDDKLKTRGVRAGDIKNNQKMFEDLWARAIQQDDFIRGGSDFAPKVPVMTSLFVGLKLAHARGKPETAGRWTSDLSLSDQKPRQISFDWQEKRQPYNHRIVDGAVLTKPFMGDTAFRTWVYRDVKTAMDEIEAVREEFFEQPDAIDSIQYVLGQEVRR